MDPNQNNNNNPFNLAPNQPSDTTSGSTPSQGFDLSQTSPSNPTTLATPSAIDTPTISPETNFPASLNTPSDSGGSNFPSKSPWDSSAAVTPSSPAPLDNPMSSTNGPTELSSIASTQSPTPLSLPTNNQSISLTPPTTNISSDPVGGNSLGSGSDLGQAGISTGDNSSASSTSWSPQSMDSTQSVPVNPQGNQPMTDSSIAGGTPLPSSGFNVSDHTGNNFTSSTQDASMPAPSSPMTDTGSSLSSINMPLTSGSEITSSPPAWPATSTESASGSLPTSPSTDLPDSGSAPVGSSTSFGSSMEAAPTDLSHLVDSSMPPVGTPSDTIPSSGPSQFEPSILDQSGLPTTTNNQPTASISGEGGGSGFPKAIIFLIIGVILIVIAAVLYFVLGLAKPPISVPIEQQRLTTPPVIPTTPPTPTEAASGSATLTITPSPAGSSSASTSASAVDLLRQKK